MRAIIHKMRLSGRYFEAGEVDFRIDLRALQDMLGELLRQSWCCRRALGAQSVQNVELGLAGVRADDGAVVTGAGADARQVVCDLDCVGAREGGVCGIHQFLGARLGRCGA